MNVYNTFHTVSYNPIFSQSQEENMQNIPFFFIDRMMAAYKVNDYVELAEKLEVSRGTIGTWKNRGNIRLKYFRKCSNDTGVPLSDLTSKEENKTPPTRTIYAESTPTRYNELMNKIKVVLDSETIYSAALVSNVEAYHQAVIAEARLGNIEKQFNQSLDTGLEPQEQPPQGKVVGG